MWSKFQKYLLENRAAYGTGLMLFLVNLVIYFSLVAPMVERIGRLNEEYLHLRNERAGFEKKLEAASALVSDLDERQTGLNDFIGKLVFPSEMTRITQTLHSLARKNGLTMRSVKYALPQYKHESFAVYAVSLPLAGSYEKIRRFIYALEEMPYLMTMEDIGLSSIQDAEVSVNLNLTFYFRMEKE